MSHHLDSPIARQDIRLDITDLYLFRGERGTAFVINVCHSIAGQVPSPSSPGRAVRLPFVGNGVNYFSGWQVGTVESAWPGQARGSSRA